jgi:hypothetical protein
VNYFVNIIYEKRSFFPGKRYGQVKKAPLTPGGGKEGQLKVANRSPSSAAAILPESEPEGDEQ